MKVLLTGGMGYIGSHTAVVLIEAGHDVVLYDNLSNSKPAVLDSLETITGVRSDFIGGDVRDQQKIQQALIDYNVDAVIHFAGLKAVGESVEKPIEYYENNVVGSISLLKAMSATNIKSIIFSSSATVYGEPQYLPLDEQHPTSATNPYGRCKLQIEEVLEDVAKSDPDWRIVCLRYFNPVGAHKSGLIGEDPNDIPNNLMPYIAQVASGKLPHLNIFGNDYDTKDGTGVRDYIHVTDLAEGHLAALNHLKKLQTREKVNCGQAREALLGGGQLLTYNLGTGTGYSVLQMVKAFQQACGHPIPYKMTQRRPGDIAVCYAKADKAIADLGWQATRALEEMCVSTWRFQQSHV